MTKIVEIKVENDVICIIGDLDFNNVMSLYQKSLEFFSARGSQIIIDFSRLYSTNSAAIAVIINWMRLANKADKKIIFRNLSEDIISLVKASGLDKIIESSKN
jgi:anti-anti-sigma factor